AKGLVFLAALHFAFDITGQAAFENLQDQCPWRGRWDRGVDLTSVANLNGIRLAIRFRQFLPAQPRMPRIAVAAYRPRRVRAQELAARRHAVDAPASARKIGDLVRFREW